MKRIAWLCSPARRAAAFFAVALMVLGTTTVGAHDFWIEPSAYRPKVGALVALRLLVGQDLLGDPVPREPDAIKQFVVSLGSSQKPVPGRDGGDPAGILRVDGAGLIVIGYQSHPRLIDLAPEKFEQYLGEEGLDEIKSLRRPAGRSQPIRELFTRCAKTLLSAGDRVARSRADGDRAIGLRFELVAERNPYATAVGQDLPFLLTYDGNPQAGVLVVAINPKNPSRKLTARSDRYGRVVFQLP